MLGCGSATINKATVSCIISTATNMMAIGTEICVKAKGNIRMPAVPSMKVSGLTTRKRERGSLIGATEQPTRAIG